MKRDMELVRLILLQVEEAGHGSVKSSDFEADGYDETTAAYHIELMGEAGLIQVNVLKFFGDAKEGTVERLTWAGHEFVDATRNEAVWRKTLQTVKQHGGLLSFDLIKQLALKFGAQQLGLSDS